ncbi:phage major tail tube protein [Chromobacterium sphagni]|uniref:Phage major tail tube protein n=1 Tax=Chromobacterium sphagni TaxID=1903179 RepID=A0ABX3CC07_9NEIS|nr:phage major tail tube protein [Chromobacterium sphagni]OHX19850.1 phage major tail tube protein [Chromobacterium sphagni]
MAGLPRTLRKFNVFNNRKSFVAECLEVKLPKLAMKTEEYRGAGMIGSVDLLKGIDKLEMEHTYSGPVEEIVASFGADKHDASELRWMGSYADESDGSDHAVEVVARGRHNELDLGDAKAGDNGSFKVKTSLSYFKLVVNGKEWMELDVVNDVFKVMGVDRQAQHRKNVGL